MQSFITLNIPPPPPPPTRLETLTLAVQGARQRFDNAQAAIRQFHFEHTVLINTQFHFKCESFAEREALDRELNVLHIELDESRRGFQKACGDLAEEKRRSHGS
jgi:hypothetical protein